MMVVNGMTERCEHLHYAAGHAGPGPDLPGIRGPLLLTHGVHDRLVRPAMSQHVVSLRPEARLSMYADSGHSPSHEEPVRFGRELAAFVSLPNKR